MSATSNFITWLNELMNTQKTTLDILTDYEFKIYYLPEEQNFDGNTDLLKYSIDKYTITKTNVIPCVINSSDSENDVLSKINYTTENLSIEMFVEQDILTDVESVIESVRYVIKNDNNSSITLNNYNYAISMNKISTGNTQNYNATDYVPVMFSIYFESGTIVLSNSVTIEFKFPDDDDYWTPVVTNTSKSKFTKEVANNNDGTDVVKMKEAEVTITQEYEILIPNDENACKLIDECEFEAIHSVISVKKTYTVGETTKAYTTDERIKIIFQKSAVQKYKIYNNIAYNYWFDIVSPGPDEDSPATANFYQYVDGELNLINTITLGELTHGANSAISR